MFNFKAPIMQIFIFSSMFQFLTYQIWAQLWSVRPYHQNFLGLLLGGPKFGLKRRGPPIEKLLRHLDQSKIFLRKLKNLSSSIRILF